MLTPTVELDLDLRGHRELARKLKATPRQLKRLSRDLLKVSIQSIARRAKTFAPRSTGALRRAITGEVHPTELAGIVYVKAGDGSRTDPAMYAGYVEYGTSKWAGQPFLRPAGEAERQYLPRRVANLGALLEKAVKAS